MTQRDRRILRLLDEHFTFTTSRLALLAGFSSLSTASHRLLVLHQHAVLERARPFRVGGGSCEWHWMLGPIGARIVAAERGVAAMRPAKIAARWEKLFHGWRYRELDAQHTWFCGLIASTPNEHGAGGELAAWRSAWRVSKAWQATTDGYGRWRWPEGTELRFVLLLDDPPRVGAQQIRERLTSLPDPAWPFTRRAGFPDSTVTLVWSPTLRREQIMRRAITQHLGTGTAMPVALGCDQYAAMTPGGVHGRVWLPLGALGRRAPGRLTLRELAHAAEATTPPASAPPPGGGKR
ncbi:replication-relaxation family protein [Saccharopolyspora rosea]|uniref:Replication-relaxation family protein n=1 Tax=Saccharopolyspora rosea TaxID=524884 RepID=A0ABW3FLH6_9PSEU|nr:replication-relaxation family protein [Saccharopolyspora rosea]